MKGKLIVRRKDYETKPADADDMIVLASFVDDRNRAKYYVLRTKQGLGTLGCQPFILPQSECKVVNP